MRGSKPGERRGGRQKGTPNKRTAELQEKIEAEGITPLDFLLKVMRDESADDGRRLDAAKSAAPYVHARLSSVTVDGKLDGDQTIVVGNPEEIRRAREAFERLGSSIPGGGEGGGEGVVPN